MNIRNALIQAHTKAQCNAIVDYIGDSQRRFDALVRIFLTDEYRVVQRAAWPLSIISIAYPALTKKHLAQLIQHLKTPGLHNAVKRNTVRLLQFIEIPEPLKGTLMDTCFTYIADPKEAVAVKTLSLGILGNLLNDYPDIIPELKLLVEDRMPYETAAFSSRAKKILKQMEAITQRKMRGAGA